MKRFLSRQQLTRLGLLIGAVIIILLIIPRADHQSFTYELNQPWKYQLLTADFDMPVMRDSASAHKLRDSIDNAFVPFVKRNQEAGPYNIEKFRKAIAGKVPATEQTELTNLLARTYATGIVDSETFNHIRSQKVERLRTFAIQDGAGSVTTIDASGFLSPSRAFAFIDSAYNAENRRDGHSSALNSDIVKALSEAIEPNVIADSAMNEKFLNQEYLNVNGAQGIIKKGQRIVDRGEIVTPQIFTNLNTYLDMLDKAQKDDSTHTYFYIGQALYVLICLIGLFCFLATFRSRFYADVRKMSFIVIFITLFVVFAVVMFEYVANGIYLVPFAAIPVIVLIFFDSRTAIFSLLTTVLISALVAPSPLQFIFMEMTSGIVAALSIHQLSQRSQLLRTAAYSFIAYSVTYIVCMLVMLGNLAGFQWKMIGIFAINSVVLSFAYILILVIERLFHFTSNVTLVELSDINSPLLRRLSEEAPGTFQHSMQVSMLASEAARAIGANTQLVRTGALYHDIGKLDGPIFFTENQHGVNPHSGLDPETSAQRIIAHVTDGLALASKNKLPDVIKDFISQHHGKGVTGYFYNTAVNASNGAPVDKSKFTYPGPNPQSKETAILMMADAVEAASRSLKDYSTESIDALVDKIIGKQEAEGLFRDSNISFRDVETVKSSFKKRLATIYHTRVAYPELNKSAQ